MATPTEIEVSVDDVEYSRYEKDHRTITATVVVTGGAVYTDEDIRVDLIKARRSRDAVVATSTITLNASTDPQEFTVSFYLPDVVDQDLINLVRHGRYFVKATSVSDEDIYAESGDFDISIITVDRLKKDYLFGLELKATEVKEPKFQPQAITGVEIVEVSKNHPVGSNQLNFIYHKDAVTDATANIGSGANGVVTITVDDLGEDGNDYTVSVVVPSGTSALSASLVNEVITVNLAVSSGVPVGASNTATLVAAAVDAITGLSAVASGDGSSSLSVAEGPTQFSGGTSNVVRQFSWNGGPLVSVYNPGTYILMSGLNSPVQLAQVASTEYICLKLRSRLLLPSQNTVETLLIDRKKMDDETLRNYINQSVEWIENELLMTPIEPTNVVTERDPTTIQFSAGVNAPAPIFTDSDFDLITTPLTYFVPRTGNSWVGIQFPWPKLLRIDSLFGAIANTRVLDIDLEWVEISENGGYTQLVPFNQEIAFDFLGLIWVNAIRGAAELPNFWHYNAIVGLRDTPSDLQELIAKKAAMEILIVVGNALRPGVGSMSLSRDGVSESVSYTTAAKYGIYTGVVNSYKEWIDEQTDRYRAKYRGPLLTVV